MRRFAYAWRSSGEQEMTCWTVSVDRPSEVPLCTRQRNQQERAYHEFFCSLVFGGGDKDAVNFG